MTIDERLQFLLTSSESLHASTQELHATTQELHATALKHDQQLEVITLRLGQVVESIGQLSRIAGTHEERLADLEGGSEPTA